VRVQRAPHRASLSLDEQNLGSQATDPGMFIAKLICGQRRLMRPDPVV